MCKCICFDAYTRTLSFTIALFFLSGILVAEVAADDYQSRQKKCAIPRRDASELTLEEFRHKYALPGVPVVITGE